MRHRLAAQPEFMITQKQRGGVRRSQPAHDRRL